MLGVFAEFERAIIRDRIHASLDRARREGKRLGRPRLSPIRIDQIRQSLVEGRGVRATARRLRVSPAKVTQVRRSMMLPTEQTLESDAQQPAESGA